MTSRFSLKNHPVAAVTSALVLLGAAALPVFGGSVREETAGSPSVPQAAVGESNVLVKPVPAVVAGVEALALSAELEAYGRANKSALALATAAQLLSTVPVAVASDRKPEGGGHSDGSAPPSALSTPRSLADEAIALAAGNPSIMAIAEQAKSATPPGAATMGRWEGPLEAGPSRLGAGGRETWRVNFNGGEPAAVAIRSVGRSDLDIEVFDHFGNHICQDKDLDATPVCAWVPRKNGQFRIVVTNVGDDTNFYWLRTN